MLDHIQKKLQKPAEQTRVRSTVNPQARRVAELRQQLRQGNKR